MQLRRVALRDGVARALLAGLVALLALSAAWALRSPADAQSPSDGSFIRRAVTDDAYRFEDVYRVMIVNGKRFKRLMLNPSAFCAYSPADDCLRNKVRWNKVLPSERSVMDEHTTSWLGRLGDNEDADVYLFLTTGEDSGIRQHLNMERSEIERYGHDWDSIFPTKPDDFYAYDRDRDITCGDWNVCDPPPTTLPTPETTPSNGNNDEEYVSLDFATINGEINVGCRMTLADGSGAPTSTYVRGDRVKGACPVRNTYNTSKQVTLSMWVETTEGALYRISVISTSITAGTVRDVHLPEGTLPATTRVGQYRPVRFELSADRATINQDVNEDHLVEIVPAQAIRSQPDRVILGYDDDGGCQISGTDGNGQPIYQPRQKILLSCLITNTHSTWQPVVLTVTLSHTSGRHDPINLYALTVPPRTTERQQVNFAMPEDWPAGDTTAQSTLFSSRGSGWHTQNKMSTDPFTVATSPPRRMATTPAFSVGQAVPGETVSVTWVHRNPFSHEITDTATFSIVCGNTTQAATIVPVRVAAHQTQPQQLTLDLSDNTPTGDCYLNYLITDGSNTFVEGWSATPINQRPEYAQIHLQVRSARSAVADSTEVRWPQMEPCATVPPRCTTFVSGRSGPHTKPRSWSSVDSFSGSPRRCSVNTGCGRILHDVHSPQTFLTGPSEVP